MKISVRDETTDISEKVEKWTIGICAFLGTIQIVPIILLCVNYSWLYLFCFLDIAALVLICLIVKLVCAHFRDTEDIANSLRAIVRKDINEDK